MPGYAYVRLYKREDISIMKRNLIQLFGVAALATGLTFAQSPNPAPAPGQHKGWQHRRGARIQRLTSELNLSADQQAQAKQIFQAASSSARPLAQQMRDARLQLANDVKSGAPQDIIAKDSNNVGAIVSQMTAIRTQAFEKFYATLNPDQKEKANGLMDKFMGHRMNHMRAARRNG
jgi:Spy/CpxP family protein refolding chaperone